ncbi:MAG: hypothetical protein HOY71_42330 [Nonomuraea sp.]|nr:hypothetical protein [Nonomuraea sp.]
MRIKPWAAMAAAVPVAATCLATTPAAAAATKAPKVPAGTTAGWVVFDRTSGKIVSHRNAHRKFRSASVVKIMIAIDYLESHRKVPATDAALLKVMLRSSNDNAATSFWSRDGKGAIITRVARKLGLSDTAPPPAGFPGFWGYTSLSAYDVVRTYRYLLDTASPRVRDTILGHLRASTPCGSDGFDQTFGIPSAVPKPWAVKQGWSGFGDVPPVRCTAGRTGSGAAVTPANAGGITVKQGNGVPDYGRPVLHTTGLIGKGDRYVVAVLTAHPAGGTWRSSVSRVTQLTRDLYRDAT